MIRLIGMAAAAMAALVSTTRARAQDSGTVITVRPSGVERAEPLTLEERLERRLKRSNELLRAICTGCGAGDAVPGAKPFSPMQALRAPDRAPSQMLIPHQLPDQVIVETRQVTVPAPDLGQVAGPSQTPASTPPANPTSQDPAR